MPIFWLWILTSLYYYRIPEDKESEVKIEAVKPHYAVESKLLLVEFQIETTTLSISSRGM